MKVSVLGVKIDDISEKEALETIEQWLHGKVKRYIVTPNPEFLVAAEEDIEFKKVLNGADLSVPDGIGLNWFGGLKNRVPGIDLMEKLISLSADKGYTVGFLGGNRGVAEKAAERLRQRYQNVSIVYIDTGGRIDSNGQWIAGNQKAMIPMDILFVAFGHIKQEKWMSQNLSKLPVKVMMGVGGAFDYISGEVPRAPSLIRSLGLEWLFRLITQPWRIKRQIALLKFIWLVLH